MEAPTLAPRRETIGNEAEDPRPRVACGTGAAACAACIDVNCPLFALRPNQPAEQPPDFDVGASGYDGGDSPPTARDMLFDSSVDVVVAQPKSAFAPALEYATKKEVEEKKEDKKKAKPPVKNAEKPKRNPEPKKETTKRETTKLQPPTKPETNKKSPDQPQPTEKPKPIKAARSNKEPGKSYKRTKPSEPHQPAEGAITQFVNALKLEKPSKQPPETDTLPEPAPPQIVEQPAPKSPGEATERPAPQPAAAVSTEQKSQKASSEPQPIAKPSPEQATQETPDHETPAPKITEAAKKPEPTPATPVETKPRQEQSANKPSATKQPVPTEEKPPRKGTNPSGEKREQQPPTADSQTQVPADTVDKPRRTTDISPAPVAVTQAIDAENETPAATDDTESTIATEPVISVDILDEQIPDHAVSPEVDAGTAPIEATDEGKVVETTWTEPEPQSQSEPSQPTESDIVPVADEPTAPGQVANISDVDTLATDTAEQLDDISAPDTPDVREVNIDTTEGKTLEIDTSGHRLAPDDAEPDLDPETSEPLTVGIVEDAKDSPLHYVADEGGELTTERVETVEDVGAPEQPDPPNDALEAIEDMVDRLLGRLAYELAA